MADVADFIPKTKTAGSFDPAIQNSQTLNPPKAKSSACLRDRCGRRDLLLDRALQVQSAGRQHVGLGLDQEGIEAAAVVDAFDGVGGDAQAHVPAQRVGNEGDVAQVRQEAPLGLDVGVAHRVAHLRALGRQFAAPRHLKNPLPSPGFFRPRGFKITSIQGTADV